MSEGGYREIEEEVEVLRQKWIKRFKEDML